MKLKVVLWVFAAAALALLAPEARADGVSPEFGTFYSPADELEGSSLDRFFIQDRVTEETHRRRVVGESPPEKDYVERTQRKQVVGESSPYYDPDRPAVGSLRIGWLTVWDAKIDRPTNVPTLGFCIRFMLPPDGMHKIELSFDSSYDRMKRDIIPTAIPPSEEDFYQEYYDITLSLLGSFGARRGEYSPLYWGVGIGYAKETERTNYTDAARQSPPPPILYLPGGKTVFRESSMLQLKLGWDSGRNTYIEVVYKKLLDSNRNLNQVINVVLGVYF